MILFSIKNPSPTFEDLITAMMDYEWRKFDERIMESRMRVLANMMIDSVLANHAIQRLKTVSQKAIIKTG